MSLINVSNLTFSYDGSYGNIFESVSFSIDTSWKLGFTGRNGKGKTTFFNLLLGNYEYTGKISSNVNFEYFPYEVQNKKINTIDVINNICLNYTHWEVVRELSLLEVSEEVLYRPFETLSNGEQTKVLLVALFLKESSFLLIDEPTNHLDALAREVISRYLKSKKSFILVSHDRTFLDSCIDHILAINKTNIEIQRGNFSSWFTNKERLDHFELSKNEKLKKDIKRLKESAEKSERWADKVESTKIGKGSMGIEKNIDTRAYIGEKSRRMQQRKKNIERRQQRGIDEKSSLLKNIESIDELKMSKIPYHAKSFVTLRNISIFYDEKMACNNISFAIEEGERIALCGKNGSGKSTIIKLICGENIKHTGEFHKGSNLKISYVSQDTSFIKGNLSKFALDHGIDESLFKAILQKFNFSKEQFEEDIINFSGGQKKKVLIAKSLCEKAHLYVWDEPLNYIDVISRMQIENLLLKYKPTILFVEHDSTFCSNIATKKVICN